MLVAGAGVRRTGIAKQTGHQQVVNNMEPQLVTRVGSVVSIGSVVRVLPVAGVGAGAPRQRQYYR